MKKIEDEVLIKDLNFPGLFFPPAPPQGELPFLDAAETWLIPQCEAHRKGRAEVEEWKLASYLHYAFQILNEDIRRIESSRRTHEEGKETRRKVMQQAYEDLRRPYSDWFLSKHREEMEKRKQELEDDEARWEEYLDTCKEERKRKLRSKIRQLLETGKFGKKKLRHLIYQIPESDSEIGPEERIQFRMAFGQEPWDRDQRNHFLYRFANQYQIARDRHRETGDERNKQYADQILDDICYSLRSYIEQQKGCGRAITKNHMEQALMRLDLKCGLSEKKIAFSKDDISKKANWFEEIKKFLFQ